MSNSFSMPTEYALTLCRRLKLNQLDDCLRFPKYFEVETVNACNARCTMCTIDDWEKAENPIMSDELFEKFVTEVSEHSDWIASICLNRDGEPTLDKHLPEKVKALKDVGIKHVTFATNVQRLTPELAERLFEAGLDDVMLSIDGITKETYEAIRLRLNYDTVLSNALHIIKRRNELGAPLTIRVRMVIIDENKHELEAWQEFWYSKLSPQDQVYAKPAHTWGNQLRGVENSLIDKYASTPCISPFSTMVIQSDGRVSLCAVDYNVKHLMGDFLKDSIEDIWKGEAFQNMRRIHALQQRNDIPMCQGCNIWDEEVVIRHE